MVDSLLSALLPVAVRQCHVGTTEVPAGPVLLSCTLLVPGLMGVLQCEMQLGCSGLSLQSALLFDVVLTAAGADDAYIGAVSQALPARYACWWHCCSSNQE